MRSMLHPAGRTKKRGHFKLQKFLTPYRHGKVSYRLISWLVLSKTLFELSWFQLIGRHVDISTKPRDTKLESNWLKPFNKRPLVERNRAKLYFRSTTFKMLKGIFQRSTSHDTLFNICWTSAATFVAQQILNRVSFALNLRCKSLRSVPCCSLTRFPIADPLFL